MSYLDFESSYDRYPETTVDGFDDSAWNGWEQIGRVLKTAMEGRRVFVADCYPGVNEQELSENLIRALKPDVVIRSEDIFFDGERLTEIMQPFLTDDRVRGKMYHGTVSDFVDPERLSEAQRTLECSAGTVLVYGFAASLITHGDILLYADMTRWEIQLRYRKGMPNYKQRNYDEDILRKYKRGYFVEWRIADRHKKTLYDSMDFYLDVNTGNSPNMVSGAGLLAGLKTLTKHPFRLVPYFDPGVWGGQWMKEVCHLDKSEPNYAWSFDGVPEENSVFLRYGSVRVETPAMNLTQYLPKNFIGEKNYARFGAEFPIRFDFLDTMGGQNLSLQVHPLTDYIYNKFGMPYTQDESYYILDCGETGGVYLGLKENVDPQEMISDLELAQTGAACFPAEKYVNRFPAKKHDHFLIPAGTVHCSTADCMVLEVSATPYIFTFKLWDWDRVGLDGLPRPIHIEDGKKVIQFDRDTNWVRKNLINRFETISETEHFKEVKTGLHELEFIETHVFTTDERIEIVSDGEFSMLNLVDGQAAVVESTDGWFPPYTVHYAETFIIPADAGNVVIRPAETGRTIKVLRADIRNS